MKLYNNELLEDQKKRAGLSLYDLERETGLSINTIRAALAGRDSVQLPKLKIIADFLAIDWYKLFEKQEPQK